MIDNVTDILPFGDYIFVIINNGESIKCFDSHSLTEFEVDATSLNTLKTAKLRQITKIGADFYLLLSPENIFEGKFELSKITINQDTVTLQPPSTFYVSSAFLTTFEGYNDIYSVEIIQNTLKHGDNINLVGFGKFEVKHRAKRKNFNPHTKRINVLPASRVPTFKPGKTLKTFVC